MTVLTSNVLKFFKDLNKSNHNYILLRNIDDELPSNLMIGKDIDLLVHQDSGIEAYLGAIGFQEVPHPHISDTYIYSLPKPKFFYNLDLSLYIDLQYNAACRSIHKGFWMPLDSKIQCHLWANTRIIYFDSCPVNYPSISNEFVLLIIRAIFDKVDFPLLYMSRIRQILPLINISEAEQMLELVFFRFTKQLLYMAANSEFASMKKAYLAFSDY